MKKIIIITACLVMLSLGAFASELTDDYLDIARSYSVKGDYAGAISYVDRAISYEPENKDLREIRSVLIRLLNINQKSHIVINNSKLNSAMEAKKSGNDAAQLQILNQAATNGNFWVYSFLGDYYREHKNYPKAIEAYSNAYNDNQDFTQALLAISICLVDMGKYEDALPHITRFLYHNQQEDFAYFIRAKAYIGMSRFNDAETEINTAIALNDDIEYQYLHGIILYNKGYYGKAKDLLLSLSDYIQTAEIYKYIGLSYLGLKDYNNALINLDKAIILSDDDEFLIAKYNEAKSLVAR